MKHYHNTTNENSIYVEDRKEKNKTQEELVYDIFQKEKKLTASDVLNRFPKNIPLTSIRRALSNLQYENKIIKTDDKKEGLYGAPEKFYIISGLENRQFSLL